MPLHPRHRIDVSLPDLSWALSACVRAPERAGAARSLEALAATGEAGALATLSVRSAFDLLLSALALPAGSEVMLSALTIPDMPRLVEAHGLVPVPVDVEAGELSPSAEALERAWSPRARVLVVAQLLGARARLDAAARFARERGLLLVNDDAQGFTGRLGGEGDVVFRSFGTIKTATALGGGLALVRDAALLEQMRRLQRGWPVQSTDEYARKLALHAALLLPRQPPLYAGFAGACERLGPGLDHVVMGMTRGFPAADLPGFLARIRRQPCAALLALLQRRIGSFDAARVARRARAGEQLRADLAGCMETLGSQAESPTHWLFAVLVDDPDAWILPLRRGGFDAARGATSIAAVPAPPDRPWLAPQGARRVMARVLFLPIYPEIPDSDRRRLTGLLRAGLAERGAGGARA